MAQCLVIDLSSDGPSPMQEQSRSHYSTTSRAGSNAHRIEAQDDPFDISLDFDLPLPPSKRQKRDVPAAVGKQRLLSSPKLPSEFIVSRTPATTQPIESQLLGLDPPVTSDAFSHKARVEVIISTDPPESDGGESSSPRQPALIDLSLKTNTLLAEISANARPRQKTRGIPTAPQATTKQQSGGTRKQHADPDKCEAKERLKEQRRKEKEAETERRSVVKEAEKSRKRAEKEQKDAKKQEAAELAGANKARWDKNVSAAEMLVDLPASIEGKPLEREIRDVLKALNVDATTYTSILPNIVRFRRKITTSFNKELGYWEPVLEKIQEEKQAICLISGQHFLAMATAPDAQKEGVDAFMTMVKMQYADFKVTCLIDGLETAVKKGTKATRKAYSAAVRDQGQSEGSEQGPSRYDAGASISRQPGMSIEDKIEETLVALQVNHSCLVHQTGSSQETAEFIGSFTREMSTVPYRSRLNGDATFCMDFGQIRTGDSDDDTYVKMLQQVTRVTESVAGGIANQYPNVFSLVTAFKKHGPLMLEDLTKRLNADGSRSETRIGQALSRRVYNVFMGMDPEVTDI